MISDNDSTDAPLLRVAVVDDEKMQGGGVANEPGTALTGLAARLEEAKIREKLARQAAADEDSWGTNLSLAFGIVAGAVGPRLAHGLIELFNQATARGTVYLSPIIPTEQIIPTLAVTALTAAVLLSYAKWVAGKDFKPAQAMGAAALATVVIAPAIF